VNSRSKYTILIPEIHWVSEAWRVPEIFYSALLDLVGLDIFELNIEN